MGRRVRWQSSSSGSTTQRSYFSWGRSSLRSTPGGAAGQSSRRNMRCRAGRPSRGAGEQRSRGEGDRFPPAENARGPRPLLSAVALVRFFSSAPLLLCCSTAPREQGVVGHVVRLVVPNLLSAPVEFFDSARVATGH